LECFVAVIELINISKRYYLSESIYVDALMDINLSIDRGEILILMGPSGSGKTTLLNIIGTLDKPTSGRVIVEGRDVTGLDEDELSEFRLRRVGFVFQQYNLLQTLTALENVELPMLMSGLYTRDEAETKARLLLDLVGVGDGANNKPSQLSGGQQQRVAVARAISMNPSFVIMDEPTGAIDAASAAQLLSLIKAMNALGKTFIIATHNPEVARIGGRIATLRSGRLLEGGAVEHPMEEVDVRRIASTYRRCLDIDLLALKRISDASEVDRIEEEINSVSSFLGDN